MSCCPKQFFIISFHNMALHALLLLATPAFLVAEEVCEELGLLQHMRSPKVLDTAPLPDLREMLIRYGINGGEERVNTMDREERRDTMLTVLGLSKGQADGALEYGIAAAHLPGTCGLIIAGNWDDDERFNPGNFPYGDDAHNDFLHCMAGRPCKDGLADEPRCTPQIVRKCTNDPVGNSNKENRKKRGFVVLGLSERLPTDKDLAAFAYMALLASNLGIMRKCADESEDPTEGGHKPYDSQGNEMPVREEKGFCYMKQYLKDPKCPYGVLINVIKTQIQIEERGGDEENLNVGIQELAQTARRVLAKNDGSKTATIVSVDFDLQGGTLASGGDQGVRDFEVDNSDGVGPATKSFTSSVTFTEKSSFTKTKGWTFTGSATFEVPVVGGVSLTMSASTTHSFENNTETTKTKTESETWNVNVPEGKMLRGKIIWSSWKADVPYTMVLRNSLGREFTVHGIWHGVMAGKSRIQLDEGQEDYLLQHQQF